MGQLQEYLEHRCIFHTARPTCTFNSGARGFQYLFSWSNSRGGNWQFWFWPNWEQALGYHPMFPLSGYKGSLACSCWALEHLCFTGAAGCFVFWVLTYLLWGFVWWCFCVLLHSLQIPSCDRWLHGFIQPRVVIRFYEYCWWLHE